MELKGCGQPWFEMQIEYNEKVGCCCYYKFEKDNLTMPLDIDRYWNGDYMKQLRGTIASNNADGTGCEGCQYIKYGTVSGFTTIPEGLTKIQSDNWDSALTNYHKKEMVIDSYPVKYYMNFGLACNLNCVMCSQEDMRHTDRRQLPVEPLRKLKDYLVIANEIAIIGGEPLMIPNSRKFIETVINDPDYSNVKLSIYTNGTLLHNYIEPFKNMKRLGICISLDSVGEAYEYIRKGARWQNTERNILNFKETGEKYGLDWNVSIAAVIMKSSIPRMVDFVDWCIENETPVHFVPIQKQGFTQNEEVFNYPELLNDIPDWEDIFDTAIEKLKNKGWIAGAANPLTIMKDEIKTQALVPRGEALFSTGDVEGALKLFIEVSEKDPENVTAINNIAVSHWQLGNTDTSMHYFLKALKLAPYDRDTVINCGKILISLDQPEDAKVLYLSYLQKSPDEEISELMACLEG